MTFEPRSLENFSPSKARSLHLNERTNSALGKVISLVGDGPLSLRKPDSSVWYKLRAAMFGESSDGFVRAGHQGPFFLDFVSVEPQIFVVEHNWAAAFEGATDFSTGEYPLPFDRNCFEFLLNGKRVCALAKREKDAGPTLAVCILTDENWVSLDPKDPQFSDLVGMVQDNIRAICIALDAQVAYTDVVRVPLKLNESRLKNGKAALPDYRVVKLHTRTRARPLEGEPTGIKVRLHFRRGHWRHFSAHKTWINWMLVGDPDMAFVDKYYRT